MVKFVRVMDNTMAWIYINPEQVRKISEIDIDNDLTAHVEFMNGDTVGCFSDFLPEFVAQLEGRTFWSEQISGDPIPDGFTEQEFLARTDDENVYCLKLNDNGELLTRDKKVPVYWNAQSIPPELYSDDDYNFLIIEKYRFEKEDG